MPKSVGSDYVHQRIACVLVGLSSLLFVQSLVVQDAVDLSVLGRAVSSLMTDVQQACCRICKNLDSLGGFLTQLYGWSQSKVLIFDSHCAVCPSVV